MNPILSALQAGYSPEKIVNYIKKIDPDLSVKINTALQAGHSIEKVLNYFSKMGSKISSLLGKPEKSESNIYKTAQQSIHPFIRGAAQGVGMLGAGAAGAYALGRAAPQAAQAFQGELLPAIPKSPAQALQLEGQVAKQLPFIEAEAQAIKPPPSPMQPQAPQAPIVQQPIAQLKPLPESLQKQISKLSEIGNDANQIEGYLQKFHPKEVKSYEKSTNTPIRSAIEEYSKSIPAKEQAKPMGAGVQEVQQLNEGKISEPIPKLEEKVSEPELGSARAKFPNLTRHEKPLKEKRKTVALPNGDIGEITNIRQGIATVNSNGKEYRRKVEELIESPIHEKDLAELHEELMKGIEAKTGQEISRMVNWAGYDPKTNELAFVPHSGALYIYDNISPEDAKQLTSVLSRRKSTGENFMGPWIEGTQSPIGASMSKLIQKLQKERGGRGNEYKGKYEKIYDAIEPAKVASKQKFEEKQSIKRSEKKSEKEKAKKEKELQKATPKSKKRKESEIIDERLGKEYDRLMKLDEEIRQENRSGEKIDVTIRSQKIKQIDAQQKRVDELRDALNQAFIDEKQDKELENEKRKAQKPRLD